MISGAKTLVKLALEPLTTLKSRIVLMTGGSLTGSTEMTNSRVTGWLAATSSLLPDPPAPTGAFSIEIRKRAFERTLFNEARRTIVRKEAQRVVVGHWLHAE